MKLTRRLLASFASIAAFLVVTNSPASIVEVDFQHSSFKRRNNDTGTTAAAEVDQCTPAQLAIIEHQLPPHDCLRARGQPWLQECSLTYATRCPDNVWLQRHYARMHHEQQTKFPKSPFLGIFVGCNKGLDAVDAMRMGTGDPAFDKSVWWDAMTNRGRDKLSKGVCDQEITPQFNLPRKSNATAESLATDSSHFSSSSQLHCIEPMPSTARLLQRSASVTKFDRMGFIVTHAAMAKEDGMAQFYRSRWAGTENKGIGACNLAHENCMNVTVYSLDTYLEKFVPKDMLIDYLSVDVEGHDYEVLLGGTGSALGRVRYLEFEYNWMGPWKQQPLSEAVERLDKEFGFTCYWAGFNGTVWRMTRCWLDHYDIHFWSNVACVNRNDNKVREVAEDMEYMFLETLIRDDAIRDFEHRYRGKLE